MTLRLNPSQDYTKLQRQNKYCQQKRRFLNILCESFSFNDIFEIRNYIFFSIYLF